MPGNDVKVSGVKVGTVTDVALQRGKALVTFMVIPAAGRRHHRAHIRTELCCQRVLTLEPDGKGTQFTDDPGDRKPAPRIR